MNNTHEVPLFLRDWKRAIVVFPAMLLYCGFLPTLKLCGYASIDWLWALAPVWLPLLGFWLIVGMVAFIASIVELSILMFPDKDEFSK